jgi:O-antigen ligase
MTGSLLAVIFAVTFVYERKKDLLIWICLAIVPIIAMTRTAVVATGLTLPLTFAPFKMSKRFVLLIVIVVIGIGLFYTERFQRKMFYSGKGTVADLKLSNPNFFSSGRTRLWELMNQEIMDKPFFGHGANAQEDFIFSYAGFYGQPHNDWLRLLFDYGYFGASSFAFCVLLQMFHAWKRGRNTIGGTRVLFYAGASGFLPFVLFMFTDNIILYVSFFGNLHFAILGLAYASLKTSMKDAAWYQYQAYLSSLSASNDSSKR